MREIVVLALCSALAGILIYIFQRTGLINNRFLFKKKRDIGINFARFFGAYQVPFYLRSLESQSTNCISFLTEDSDDESPIDFFRRWEYSKAKIIKSEVYDFIFSEYPGNAHHLGEKLLLISSENDEKALDFFSTEIDYTKLKEPFASYCYTDPYVNFRQQNLGKYEVSEVLDNLKSNSNRIGFLLLFIDNISNESLYDVEIHYELYKNPNPFEMKYHLMENDKRQKSKKMQKQIDFIKPKECFLWLLCVYESDDRGYPKTYITDVIHPSSIRYKKDSASCFLKIREPLKDKAVKVKLPFGWYHQ